MPYEAMVSSEKSSAPCASLFKGLSTAITKPPMMVQKMRRIRQSAPGLQEMDLLLSALLILIKP